MHNTRRRSAKDDPTIPQRTANVIREIEGNVSHFSGDNQMKVERWIDKFET